MDLINQGLNLLSTGMITVFFFLFLILNINIKEYYKELRYSKKRYQEFREVINAAAKFYESSVRIEKI